MTERGGQRTAVLTIPELVHRAAQLSRRGARALLGITGPPGTGKSTVCDAIAAALAPAAVVVGMDGFHLAQAELVRLHREDRKGAPDTFDVLGYLALLRRLRAGTEPIVYAPLFRRDLEEPVGSCVPVPQSTPLIVTEGNYLLLDEPGWRDVRAELDEVWYLSTPDDERHERLVRRRRLLGAPEQEARNWAFGSDERNAVLVDATRARADLIVQVSGP